jgi:hypothetical protein
MATASVFVISDVDAGDFPSPSSLCRQGEEQYFSCKLQSTGKIASICAKDNINPDSGYVQYRLGTKEHVEYKFPGKLEPPRGKISILDVSRLRDGVGSHVKLNSGKYTYVTSNALIPGEIYVARDGKIVFDGIFKGREYIPFSVNARHGLQYGIPIPIDELDQHTN